MEKNFVHPSQHASSSFLCAFINGMTISSINVQSSDNNNGLDSYFPHDSGFL